MQIPNHDLLADVLMKSLEKWAKRDKTWGKHFKKLSDTAIEIIRDSFREMAIHKPYHFDVWWMKNHMRYYKRYRQEEMRILYQLIYNFLSAYARGSLDENGKKDRKAEAS